MELFLLVKKSSCDSGTHFETEIHGAHESIFDAFIEACTMIKSRLHRWSAHEDNNPIRWVYADIQYYIDHHKYEKAIHIWNSWNRDGRQDSIKDLCVELFQIIPLNSQPLSDAAKEYILKQTPYPEGMKCHKCDYHNSYVIYPTELNGTYVCQTCKARDRSWGPTS